ncbi:MAG: hypothetical protein EON59_08695 [Alphaproteobacteria bacterium]|nr:MAG: hypothetical protein EON59_08695 [Alphaproteobacteria bacterium]
MSRYFFQINDGSSPDISGFELATLAVAKCEAVKMAAAMVCDAASRFWDTHDFSMSVTDEVGETLFRMAFIGSEGATEIPLQRIAAA